MRSALVVADDFGISEGISRGILHAHEHGIVTAASVMANGRWTARAAEAAGAHPALALGAHLVFTGEDPLVLSRAEIPTLLDRRGLPPATWRHLVAGVLARRIDPEDLRREGRAQLSRLRHDLGLRLTHLNTHQHVHLLPQIAAVVVPLAGEAGIGYVRSPSSATASPRARVIRRWRGRLVGRLRDAGLATSQEFGGLDEAGRMTAAGLCRLVASAAPSVEITVHPGWPTDRDRQHYRWGYRWEHEVTALVDPAPRRYLRAAGVDLVNPSHVVEHCRNGTAGNPS